MKKLLPKSKPKGQDGSQVISINWGHPKSFDRIHPLVNCKPHQQLSLFSSDSKIRKTRKWRIAFYSHDTMGLGHKRRQFLIAQTLGSSSLEADILMISGMSDVSDLPKPDGVDLLTLPSLYKNAEGQYQSRHWDLSLQEIIALRSQVIRTTIKAFAPDVLIVDNVPRGAMRELDPTLEYLRDRGQTRCILGLRDVLDEPEAVVRDWERGDNEKAIRDYYDAVWVYGDPNIYAMTQEYPFSKKTLAKFHYLGYLDRQTCLQFADEASKQAVNAFNFPSERTILCLVGGGQDGVQLAETFAQTELPADSHGIILTGPFMPEKVRQHLQAQASQRSNLSVLEYCSEPTLLLEKADRVIAMGGYNTTCEILALQKRALIVPRVKPRKEQLVRAERLQAKGLIEMLHPDRLSPQALANWLAQTDKSPQIRDRVDLKALTRIPKFLEALLLTSIPQQKAS